MKYINNILLGLLILFAVACYDDQGNYEYSEFEEITIKNIEDSYLKLFMKDTLFIEPEVESNIPGAEMLYFWVYDGDTISSSLVLDTLVTWVPNKPHKITFRATNKNTGYTEIKKIDLNVNTPFLYSWYVLKDDDINSELDMYFYQDLSKTSNVLKLVNGDDLVMKGKGVKFTYVPNFYNFDEEQNKFVKVKTLFVMSENEIFGLDPSQLNILHSYDEMFNEPTEEAPNPNFMVASGFSILLINSGQAYTISSQHLGNGNWGIKKEINLAADPYRLSKYVYNEFFKNHLVFDDLNSSFYLVTNFSAEMIEVQDMPDTEMSATDNNKELIYMGVNKPYLLSSGYAVMQDKTDPSLKMITQVKYDGTKVGLINDTLINGVDKAYNGKLFTMAVPEEGLYFIADNKLCYRNVSYKKGAESIEFSIPSDETATFIRVIKHTENDINYDYVALGTYNNEGYKVRFFKKTTAGHLNPEPEFVLPQEGDTAKGKARDVMFISPKIPFQTYSW